MALGGDLRNINLADLFQTLSMNRQVGTLLVRNGVKEKRILFTPKGVSLQSSRTIPGFRLGRYLLRTGIVTEEDLQVALQHQQKHGGLLGSVLVSLGLCSSEAVEEVVRYHVSEELYEIFTWANGEFEFLEGVVPEPDESPSPLAEVSLDPGPVVMEAARRIDEWTLLRAELPDPNELFIQTGKAGPKLDPETWGRDLSNMYALVDGSRTYQEILRISYLSEFDTSSSLVQLKSDGYIRQSTFAELTAAAWTALDQRAPERAAPCLERAAVLQPKDTTILDQLLECYDRLDDKVRSATTLLRLADILTESGLVAEAIANLERARRYNPRCVDAYTRLFHLYGESGNEKAAIKAARTAVESLLGAKDYSPAARICREGLDIDPEDRVLHLGLADAYAGAGRREDALSELEQLATQLEVARDTRVLEVVCKKILQIDSSRRSYLERLRELKDGEVRRRRKRMRLLLAGASLFLLLSVSFFVVNSGTSAEDRFAAALARYESGDKKGAIAAMQKLQLEELDPDTEAAVAGFMLDILLEERKATTAVAEVSSKIESKLDQYFEPAKEALESNRLETALKHLAHLVDAMADSEVEDDLDKLGTRERAKLTSKYGKTAREVLDKYATRLDTLLSENAAEFKLVPDENVAEADPAKLEPTFETVRGIRQALDPALRTSAVALCSRVEAGLCDGGHALSEVVERKSESLDALHALVLEKYHRFRALSLRRKYLEDYKSTQKAVNEMLRRGQIDEAREACANFLEECTALENETPERYYRGVIEELLAKGGLDLDQRMRVQAETIDDVLRQLAESEALIKSGRYEEANALMRETIERNLKINFQQHAHLVMRIQTRPAGAEVIESWNGGPRESLGVTTPEGLVIRYRPHGETSLKVRLDTFRPVSIRIEDFQDEVPATPDFELEKLPEWAAAAMGPLDAGPVVRDGVVLIASRDGHLRGLSLSNGQTEFDHDFNLLGGFSSAPAIEHGVAYLASPDRKVFAYDLEEKRVLWSYETDAPVRTTPVRTAGMTVVIDEEGKAYGILEGATAWTRDLQGHLKSAPLGRDGRIYAATVAGDVICFDGRSGDEIWRTATGEPIYVPLVATEPRLLLVATENARLDALRMADGTTAWSTSADNALRRTPAVSGGHVYAITVDGLALVFRLDTGKRENSVRLLTETTVDGGFAAADGTISFADSTGLLIVADFRQGLLWKRQLDGRVWSPPYFHDGYLIVTTDAGNVLCFRQK